MSRESVETPVLERRASAFTHILIFLLIVGGGGAVILYQANLAHLRTLSGETGPIPELVRWSRE